MNSLCTMKGIVPEMPKMIPDMNPIVELFSISITP